jgi:hypothetical protein
MPHTYERDDDRRLITVKLIEPSSVDDILSAVERQAAEDTWEYAMLYDLRSVAQLLSEADVQTVADRVKAIGRGRMRGSVGIAIDVKPQWLRIGIRYSELTRKIHVVEVLLTAAQLDDWLARNTARHTRGHN